MKEAEFDPIAEEYDNQHRRNIQITGESPDFFANYKIRILREKVDRSGIAASNILDFGSGIGNSIPYFRRWFSDSHLTCADVSKKSLAIAQARFENFSESALIEGQQLGLALNKYDVIFSACVFHHIPHDEHVHWLSELYRVAKPGAILVIFEHNPLNPLTVHAVNTCPFDVNARLIRAGILAQRFQAAQWAQPRISYHVFFPRILAVLRPMESYLSTVPLGAQYAITARKLPS